MVFESKLHPALLDRYGVSSSEAQKWSIAGFIQIQCEINTEAEIYSSKLSYWWLNISLQ
jgi:hypothetical protein